ncbi:hypothetical protein KUCAC02_017049, partial [Chaenocephalus aceratus]
HEEGVKILRCIMGNVPECEDDERKKTPSGLSGNQISDLSVQHDVSDVHPVEYLRGQTDGGRKVLLEEKLSNTTTSILTPEYSVNNKCLHDVPDQET